jgi:two-component system OmpR family sensor kinase
MYDLVQERLLYFEAMIKAKQLHLSCHCKEGVVLKMDRNDALRLVDNLLSNAIKYNKIAGELSLFLDENSFRVKDAGGGIDARDISSIQKRFKRANKSEGGFGIGLDIVSQVVNSYGFSLEMLSDKDVGTEVIIRWEK